MRKAIQMKKNDQQLNRLRRLAEKRLSGRHKDPLKLRPDQLPTLVHELEVHQIELEMQNEELRRAQESLERAHDRFVDLYDYAPVGYLTIGARGLIEEANLTACRLFETERATLLGQRLSHFVVADCQDALYTHWRRLMAGKGPQTFELEVWGSGDEKFHAQVRMALLSGMNGDSGAYRIVIADISERRLAEEERDRLRRELQQAHKWEALGQLAGGIAHEFNNLLGIILGSAELLQHHLLDLKPGKMAPYIDHIQRAGDRASSLVSKMLAFSQGSSGQLKPLQLHALIREELGMLRTLLPTSMRVETDFVEELPSILMDPAEFSQALLNLAINGRDAMEGDGVLTIRLGWARGPEKECSICHQLVQGDWVELAVADTGCGMDSGIFNRIFDPFFTTKDVGKGSGMGLSVVLGIVRRGGGHILLNSKPGNGTTFRLLFPPAPGIYTASGEADAEPEFQPDGHGEQILILDDRQGLGSVLGDILSIQGYRTRVMTDSPEALNLFKATPDEFALVLTDQTMPEITGVEMVKLLREIRSDIPVILTTGFSPYIDAETAAGINICFLEKPVKPWNLLQAVSGLLQAKQQSCSQR